MRHAVPTARMNRSGRVASMRSDGQQQRRRRVEDVAGALALGTYPVHPQVRLSQPRSAMRMTSMPCRSSARISRRMKLWLTVGYWLTR